MADPHDACDAILKNHHKAMFNTAMMRLIGKVPNAEENANDAVQEARIVFTRWFFAGQIQYPTAGAFILKQVQWQCDNIVKAHARRTKNEVSLEDPLPSGDGCLGDAIPDRNGTNDPVEDLIYKATKGHVENCLNALTDNQFQVIFYKLKNMKYVDIATALDIPEETVKQRLYQARRALQNCLKKKGILLPKKGT